ncbi:unnamed protein product [Ceutorhynchus assimilis]|uniref:AB hydrolase-1 domain-containing protein n=1 Tax=Ceutorhynchus assimilis TaxID=467358 RepID=A0A9N9QGH9_9CUCU|nr:unnamed protein product [Ceutorhynchus assimilis]
MAKKAPCIQSISVYGQARIHFLSFIFGVWVVCKKIVKWVWNPSASGKLQLRDTPPPFLVDSSLGQHKHVKLKGVKLHYVESGPKHQPLILLLHGFPDFWLSWRYQIPVLSTNFHVVALDLKGFGDSDKPAWRTSYKIDRVLEELTQFIYSFGVSNCIIIGHDLGALLGWYLVHQNPSVVSKFVTISCPHPNVYWQTLNSKYNYQWLNYVQLPYLPEIDALKEDVKIIDQYYKHLPQDLLDAYKYTFSRNEDWTGPINYYRNLPFFKISEQLDQIEIPVVLLTGSKDQHVSLEGIVKSTEFCEKFRLKIIEETGHYPHQENHELFNKILLKFLIDKSSCNKDNTSSSPSKRLINGLFGAVSNTVKYGNSVIDSVQKKTNGVVNSIPFGINFNNPTSTQSWKAD